MIDDAHLRFSVWGGKKAEALAKQVSLRSLGGELLVPSMDSLRLGSRHCYWCPTGGSCCPCWEIFWRGCFLVVVG